jgi:glycosyltransferase involved in cell wall biosynthesis
VCAAVRESGEAVVCTYNPLLWQVYAAQAAVRKGARWISFVLDDDGVAQHGWSRYLKQTEMAAGHVFVSQWAYEQAPVRNKLLMEGGVEAWRGDKVDRRSRVPSVMYAGLFSRSAGMEELLALIEATARQDVEFWVCGRGMCPELSRRVAQDQRIKLLGFLSEEALDQRLRSAWVLVNPRSVTHEESQMNFPSKLLRYLSYGMPVVTVWTPGIPAEYREVLQVTDPDVCGSAPAAIGQAMARQVEGVLQWDADQRQAWQDKIQKFVVPGKLWASQGERLVEFMKSLD